MPLTLSGGAWDIEKIIDKISAWQLQRVYLELAYLAFSFATLKCPYRSPEDPWFCNNERQEYFALQDSEAEDTIDLIYWPINRTRVPIAKHTSRNS